MISNLIAMVHLQQSLRNRSLTPQEKHVLVECRKRADLSFYGGAILGGAISLLGTWRLRRSMFRAAIGVGAVFGTGLYASDRSQRFCAEEILDLDGSQLQIALAAVIMHRHSNNATLMQLVSRHFYAEDVLDDSTSDSTSDSTVRKLRYRNFFLEKSNGDSPGGHDPQAEYGDGPYGHGSQADTHVNSISNTDDKKASVKSKQLPITSNSAMMDNPLDQIFGGTRPAEEIQLSSGTRTPAKEPSRSRKRSHRRRRQRQREAAADWEHVQPQRI